MIMEDVHWEDPSTNWNKIKELHDHKGVLHVYWDCDNPEDIPQDQKEVIWSLWEACGEVGFVCILNGGYTSDILLSK